MQMATIKIGKQIGKLNFFYINLNLESIVLKALLFTFLRDLKEKKYI